VKHNWKDENDDVRTAFSYTHVAES